MITGGCLCGALRYEAGGTPLVSLLCYCRDCQRATGSSHAPVMIVARAEFRATGEVRSYGPTGGSGNRATRNFCATCGSLVYGTPEAAPRIVTIYAGSLDDASAFKPAFAQFTRHRPEWSGRLADLPEFEDTAPPPRQ